MNITRVLKLIGSVPYQINFLYIPVLFVIQTDHEEGATQKEQQGQSARKAVTLLFIFWSFLPNSLVFKSRS